MHITDLIALEEVTTWTTDDIITITAGTGKGKSRFIKTTLHDHAKKQNKKILMLVHRSNCANQFKDEITRDGKQDIIDILTYQYLETLYTNGGIFDFSQYEYIVVDEFHYFLSDALFNPTTDISLNIILSLNKTRILMSATADKMEQYLLNIKGVNIKNYSIPKTFDFIKSLNFFYTDSEIERLAHNAITNNQKCMIFQQSAKDALNLYNQFKDHALFCCSKSNENGYYANVEKSKINTMLQQERFDETLLITTTCLDAGINIIDEQLKHIIVDVKDIDTLIQCIGRKRLTSEDDYIHVYVKCLTNNHLGGLIQKMKKKIEMAEYRMTHTLREYLEKYNRKSSDMLYDMIIDGEDNQCNKAVNEMSYYKCKTTINELTQMIQTEYGFAKTVANKLGFYDEATRGDYNVIMIEEKRKMDDLIAYMNSIAGTRLFKEEQLDLINKIDLRDSRGRLQKSIDSLNLYFVKNNLPFLLDSKVSRINIYGVSKPTRFWELVKVINTEKHSAYLLQKVD